MRKEYGIIAGIIFMLLLVTACGGGYKNPRACYTDREGWFRCDAGTNIVQCHNLGTADAPNMTWELYEDCTSRDPPQKCNDDFGWLASSVNPGCEPACEYPEGSGNYYEEGTTGCADASLLGTCLVTGDWNITDCAGMGSNMVCIGTGCTKGCLFAEENIGKLPGEVFCSANGTMYHCSEDNYLVKEKIPLPEDMFCQGGNIMCLRDGIEYDDGGKACSDDTSVIECQPKQGGWIAVENCTDGYECVSGECYESCTDADEDGYGAPGTFINLCPQNWAEDCDDNDALINPGADEFNCTDSIDNNCRNGADCSDYECYNDPFCAGNQTG